jgi:DNA-binding transcriptional ArsR family regulator
MKKDKTIYELQAEVCKVLASPKRIEIITALKGGEKSVTELIGILGISKANVSQHLAVMRLKGILKSRREGLNIYYCIAHPKVVQACSLMREVLSELLTESGKMASSLTSKSNQGV